MSQGQLPPLLFFGDDWGRRPSTLQHVARHLMARHAAVWVNGINQRLPRADWQDIRRGFEKVAAMLAPAPPMTAEPTMAPPSGGAGQPLMIVPPRILPWHHLGPVRALNGHLLGRDVARACRTAFGSAAPLVITSVPAASWVVPHVPNAGIVYYCLDEYAATDGVDPELVLPAESRLLSIADAVLVTSSSMLGTKRPSSGRVYHGPQGVNFQHFAGTGDADPEIAALPAPRIGFAGGIASSVDADIIRALARAFPHGSIVLVGERRRSLGEIEAMPNVHVLARRAYAVLPQVLRAFDVGIIPYVESPWTIAVDPLKLLEYLAAGLPVVSTPLPDVRRHAEAVHLASSPTEFVEAVAVSLSERSAAQRAARQAYASRHDWAHRADAIEDVLRDVAAARQDRARNTDE